MVNPMMMPKHQNGINAAGFVMSPLPLVSHLRAKLPVVLLAGVVVGAMTAEAAPTFAADIGHA